MSITTNIIKLQPRLKMIADLVPLNTRIVDVGTDHGYLPVYLLQNKIVKHAIASDIKIEPLNHAKDTARKYGIDSIEFILTDGLNYIDPNAVDTIIIAGMGGDSISNILSKNWSHEKYLVLQPMTKQEYLREWLCHNNFFIKKEVLVYDKGYIYPILLVQGGIKRELSDVQSYLGFIEKEDPLYNAYISQKIKKLENILSSLNKSNSNSNKEKAIRELLTKCKEIK